MIPIVLKPVINGLVNRWKIRSKSTSTLSQDIVMALFFFLVAATVWYATHKCLIQVNTISALVYLPPARPIGLMLILLSVMLLVSNIVIAIGALFKAKDLDLILSSSIKQYKLIFGKLVYIFLLSSWMPFTFLIPLLWAFGINYSASPSYYVLGPILVGIYFFILTATASIIVVATALFFPIKRTKEFLMIGAILFLYLIYKLVQLSSSASSNATNTHEILRLLEVVSLPNVLWLPPNWISEYLSNLLEPGGQSTFIYLQTLLSTAVFLVALSYFVLAMAYKKAFNRVQSLKSSQSKRKDFPELGLDLSPQIRGMLVKEVRNFTRDIGQIIQMVLLITICIYLPLPY